MMGGDATGMRATVDLNPTDMSKPMSTNMGVRQSKPMQMRVKVDAVKDPRYRGNYGMQRPTVPSATSDRRNTKQRSTRVTAAPWARVDSKVHAHVELPLPCRTARIETAAVGAQSD